MLKLLDLFSGIGGFSLGMEATKRIKTIGFVEKDKFCQKVLNKNFKNIPIEEDIRNVKGQRYTADIISGGFPCQPFSIAGKRRGTDDDRYLWDETIRVVRECKPKWFVGENVEGLINISNGEVLQQIQKDLEKENFQVQCLIIPASGVGAWHQRKRVWIIGSNVSNSNLSRSFKEYSSSFNRQDKRDGSINESSSRSNKNVSNSKKLRNGGRSSEECRNQQWEFQPKEQKRSEVWSEVERCSSQNLWHTKSSRLKSSINRQGKKQFRGTNSPGVQCKKTWWEIESELCGVPDGVSYELDKDRTNRIKSLGNSIVPQIAYEIGKAIVDAEDSSD